jgi:hypothetical protein
VQVNLGFGYADEHHLLKMSDRHHQTSATLAASLREGWERAMASEHDRAYLSFPMQYAATMAANLLSPGRVSCCSLVEPQLKVAMAMAMESALSLQRDHDNH